MKKKLLIISGSVIGLFILIGIIAIASSGDDTIDENTETTPTETLTTTQENDEVIEDEPEPVINDETTYIEPLTFEPVIISGVGDKKTAPFAINTQEWIIDWEYYSSEPEYASFGFFIYPRGDTVMYVESMIFPSETSGSIYSYAGPGEYYADVSCANLDNWSVIIRPAE